jgi:maleate isomerase
MALLERNDAPARSAPVNIGQRLRVGMMVPSVNFIADPQIQAMFPEGVQIHTTRMKLVGSSEDDIRRMVEDVDRCAALLADADPQRILFHCTAASTISPDMGAKIRARITQLTGIPANDTAESLLAAFDALGARKIVMVSPYPQRVNDHEVEFFSHFGIEVLREHGLGLSNGRAFAQVTPDDWYRIVMEHQHKDADAYFISCAQARGSETVERLEQELQRPVVTSNTAVAWHCLRQSGVNDAMPGFGRLLRM